MQNEKVIIVNSSFRPMAYSKYVHQLCPCDTTEWKGVSISVEVYSIDEAKKHIKNTRQWQKRNSYSVDKYFLMPVKL